MNSLWASEHSTDCHVLLFNSKPTITSQHNVTLLLHFTSPYHIVSHEGSLTTPVLTILHRPSASMCTTYEFNYLRCQREVKRDCKHIDHFPCEEDMCKGDEHQHVTLEKEEKCPVHKMVDEQEIKMKDSKGKKMGEWPVTNCRPM